MVKVQLGAHRTKQKTRKPGDCKLWVKETREQRERGESVNDRCQTTVLVFS